MDLLGAGVFEDQMSLAPHTAAASTGWTQKYQATCRAGDGRTAGTMPVYQCPPGERKGFLGFLGALVDVINPLQHIPFIGNIYRNITGDQLNPVARVVGSTLYGGPMGAGMSMASIAVESHSGQDIGHTMLAAFDPAAGAPAALAENVQVASVATAHSSASAAKIAPAKINPEDIIWYTPAHKLAMIDDAPSKTPATTSSASLSVHPTPNRTRTADGEPARAGGPDSPAAHSLTAKPFGPVHTSEGTAHDGRLTASAVSEPALALPEAPADARMALPPELMAMKMREGLDKYAAMKARGL